MSFLISIWRIFVNFLSHRFPVKFNFNCLFCLQLQGTKSISKQTFLASVLFSRCRSSDNTPENCLFQIALYSRAYYAWFMKRLLGQIPLGPSLGKQNILAKEVYRWIPFSRTAAGRNKMLAKTKFRIFRQLIADISKRNVGERV